MVNEGFRPSHLFPNNAEGVRGIRLSDVTVSYDSETTDYRITYYVRQDKASPNAAYR